MPDDPQSSQARNESQPQPRKLPLCRRCRSELQYLAAIPKRVDSPACEIFRCAQCAEVQWVERE